jgi:hypothetical protein
MQGPIRSGAECWVLYPRAGVRPVAEGIAGSLPGTLEAQGSNDRSFLLSLSEAGDQTVTVTGCYKKNIMLMCEHANTAIRYLEDVVTATAACDKTVKWNVRYVVEKAAELQPANLHLEQSSTKQHV